MITFILIAITVAAIFWAEEVADQVWKTRDKIASLIQSARFWISVRRRCAWCGERTGGNPLAKKTSDGVCDVCRKELM